MTARRAIFFAISTLMLAGGALAEEPPASKLDGTWKLSIPARDGSTKGSELRVELKSDDQKIKGTAVSGRKTLEVVGEQLKGGKIRLVARTKSGSTALTITATLEKGSLKGSVSQAGQTQEFTGRRVADKEKNVLKDRQQQGLR